MNKSTCKIESGIKRYYLNNLLHREDGPAIEYSNGDQDWFFEGKRHRLDGPAMTYADGNKSWYFNGKRVNCKSQKEFERLIAMKVFW
jgi:hypothetical protein